MWQVNLKQFGHKELLLISKYKYSICYINIAYVQWKAMKYKVLTEDVYHAHVIASQGVVLM